MNRTFFKIQGALLPAGLSYPGRVEAGCSQVPESWTGVFWTLFLGGLSGAGLFRWWRRSSRETGGGSEPSDTPLDNTELGRLQETTSLALDEVEREFEQMVLARLAPDPPLALRESSPEERLEPVGVSG